MIILEGKELEQAVNYLEAAVQIPLSHVPRKTDFTLPKIKKGCSNSKE